MKACAFTGHRPKSFSWKYDESAPDCILLKEVLAEQIKTLVDRGVTDFLSGMAQGVDLWCSEIVLVLKKKNPALMLHCILPCKGQESKWTASTQERYHSILRQADEVVYVGQEYSRECMLKRNRYLVDQAQIDELENTLPNVKNQAEQERTDVVTATREKIAPLQKELDSLSEKIRDIETQINEAKYELTRER